MEDSWQAVKADMSETGEDEFPQLTSASTKQALSKFLGVEDDSQQAGHGTGAAHHSCSQATQNFISTFVKKQTELVADLVSELFSEDQGVQIFKLRSA